MRKDSPLAIRIGIFFTVAVILVIGLSLSVKRGSFFSDDYEIVANFRSVSGIEAGTQVALRGVPVGRVKSIDWNASINRVRVILEINQEYEIPRNAVAKVQISSLLGGSYINISMDEGPSEIAYLQQGDEIQTAPAASIDEMMSTISDLSSDTENLISSLNRNQEETLNKINQVVEENRDQLRQTTESFSKVGPQLEELSGRLNEMTGQMQEGKGTLGRLYQDQELYDQLKSMTETAQDITAQVKSGEGTLGTLIYGDEVISDARQIMEELRKAAQEIQSAVGENREELRSLVSVLSESGPRLETAIGNFNDISTKINSGDGTLGRLVNDPTLYEDAQRAVNQVGESFESSEEQGVFRSFLGLVFGAVI